MSNLIQTLQSCLRAIDWPEVGSVCLGIDLMLFAALATFWDEAGKWTLRGSKRRAP